VEQAPGTFDRRPIDGENGMEGHFKYPAALQ
jgi:hypothetical protein